MSRPPKKRGLHPAAAVALLVVCGGVAGRSLWSVLGPAGAATVGDAFAALGAEPVDENVGGADENAGAGAGDDPIGATGASDLLAAHGSFDRRADVRVAFTVLADVPAASAAPGPETAGGMPRAWTGEDPPLQRLGVVMVAASARRAVLGGRVVGVGESLGQMRVVAIEPGVVTVEWRGRQLHYDLEDDAPREFRAERARRGATEPAPGTESDASGKEKR